MGVASQTNEQPVPLQLVAERHGETSIFTQENSMDLVEPNVTLSSNELKVGLAFL
jgi:hypothetical protein